MTKADAPFADSPLHVSVDDVFSSFASGIDRATERAIHPAMQWVEAVHDQLGFGVDLYVFLEDEQSAGRIRLAEVFDQWARWFERRPGVRVGPHALDRHTPPHRQSINALIQTLDAIDDVLSRTIAKGQRARWVRLHEFSESYEAAGWFLDHGVDTLLVTDKSIGAWRLPASSREALLADGVTKFNGLRFRRSHLRLEYLHGLPAPAMREAVQFVLGIPAPAVVFTHEYDLVRPEVREVAWSFLRDIAARTSLSGLSTESGCPNDHLRE